MVSESTRRINRMLLISILYILLGLASSALGLTIGTMQFKLSDALYILPMYNPVAIPGIVIGTIVTTTMRGAVPIDIIGNALVAFISAFFVYQFRKNRWIAMIFPVVTNMIVVPFSLKFCYHVAGNFFELALLVGIGEFVCAYVIGQMLIDFISGDVFKKGK